MPQREYNLAALIRPLDNGLFLGESMFFPEVSRVASSPLRVRRALAMNAAALAAETPLQHRHRRVAPAALEVIPFEIQLKPPEGSVHWKEPISLTLHAALYRASGLEVAAVPGLGIEVIAPTREELLKRLPTEALAALRRLRAADSLANLAMLPRGEGLSLEQAPFHADVPTPREAARRAGEGRPSASVLKEVADDLRDANLAEAWQIEPLVARIADLLGGRNAQSVLLVGPPGVGKTAALHELVRKRRELGFAETPFFATSGSRLVAGMSGFGMWQERCNQLRVEAAKQRAILHLGQLVELMEVGKGMMIQQGVAGFLRPYIARGELLCVVECTPEQLPVIERRDPHLVGAFARLEVREPAAADCATILRRAARGRDATPAALDTLSRLHRRYATYSAWPGRPLRFLHNLLADNAQAGITPTEVYRAFSRETGLPAAILDDGAPMDLDAVRAFLAARVISQDGALELITDLLATVKSGLSRPHKPLASLLFVGPTGVGKTETAKALAEFLFSDRKRMTRFDMSEFASPGAVQRLIGGPGGEGLLVARVREQPFAVLLFDEFEKAHPMFFDLLLQVLGEARLTDAQGRLADFGNTVIIMTSNLGAENFMQGRIGFGSGMTGAAEHFTGELRKFVRPELLNRIDRVVPFLPLPPEAVKQVLRKELELIRTRPGLRDTGANLEVTEAAQDALVTRAYQPALGARPLKREMERNLLVPLAELLNTRKGAIPRVSATLENGALVLTPSAAAVGEPARDGTLATSAGACTGLRRKAQAANRAPAVLEIRNDVFRIRKTLEQFERAKRLRKSAFASAALEHDRARLPGLQAVEGAFSELLQRLGMLEDDLVLGASGRAIEDATALRDRLAAEAAAWQEALLGLMRLRFPRADVATLYMAGANHDFLFDLGRAYAGHAFATGVQVKAVWLTSDPSEDDFKDLRRRAETDNECRVALEQWVQRKSDRQPQRLPQANALKFLADPREEPGTLALQLNAPDIMLRVAAEQGRHVFQTGPEVQPSDVTVTVLAGAAMDHAKLDLSGAQDGLRRSYHMGTRQARDERLDETLAWTGARLDTVVARGIEGTFARALESQVSL